MNTSNTVRIPRIQGATLLAQTNTPDITFAHTLNHYINNGFTYQGRRLSVEELCYYTGIPSNKVQDAIINSSGVYSRLFNPDTLQSSLRALLGRALENALGDRALVLEMAEKLKGQFADAQGVGSTLKVGYLYQKSLDTVLRSQQSITNIISQVLPKGPQLNLILGFEADPNKGQSTAGYITRDEAMGILGQSNPNPLHLEGKSSPVALSLYEAHGLGEIESIIANPQDDGEVIMGHLDKVSDIIISEVYDTNGNLLD